MKPIALTAAIQATSPSWTVSDTMGITLAAMAILAYVVAVIFFLFRWSFLIKRMKERQDEFQKELGKLSGDTKDEVHQLRQEMKTEFEKVNGRLDSMGIRWEKLVSVDVKVEAIKDRVRRLEDRSS